MAFLCRPTAVASDLEAQHQQCRIPPPVHHRARGTVASIPWSILSSIPTREEVDAHFLVPQPTLVRGTVLSRHDFGPTQSTIMSNPPDYEYPPPPTVESGSAEGPSATDSTWARRVLIVITLTLITVFVTTRV